MRTGLVLIAVIAGSSIGGFAGTKHSVVVLQTEPLPNFHTFDWD